MTKEKDLGTNLLTGTYKTTDLAKVFDRSTTLLATDISDFNYYPPTNGPAAFISAPVFKEKKVIGAIIFQINNNEMYKVVNDYTGLGQTGETVIVSKVGDKGVFMTPTRFDPDAAFKRSFRLNSKEYPVLQKILKGNRFLGAFEDYRGQQVIGAGYYFLPNLQWGLLVKVDENELFAQINFLKYLLLTAIAVIATSVILASIFIAKSITDPGMI